MNLVWIQVNLNYEGLEKACSPWLHSEEDFYYDLVRQWECVVHAEKELMSKSSSWLLSSSSPIKFISNGQVIITREEMKNVVGRSGLKSYFGYETKNKLNHGHCSYVSHCTWLITYDYIALHWFNWLSVSSIVQVVEG